MVAKSYRLPLTNHCSSDCPICDVYNTLNPEERSIEQLRQALNRAVSGRYQSVLFPPNFFSYPHRDQIPALLKEFGLGGVIQVHRQCLSPNFEPEVVPLIEQGWHIEAFFDGYGVETQNWLAGLKKLDPDLKLIFVGRDQTQAHAALNKIPESEWPRLFLCFPERVREGLNNVAGLTCDEVHDLLFDLKCKKPTFPIRVPEGVEIWNPRITSQFALEPTQQPQALARTEKVTIQISVIVSVTRSGGYLRGVLTHLFRQNYNREFFEIIVLNSTNDPQLESALSDILSSEVRPFNVNLISITTETTAGAIRNLGAKHARGEILVFLDEEMLTPPQFFTDIVKQHRTWDLVQYQTFNLKRSASNGDRKYREVDLATESFASRGGYWEKFYNQNRWMDLPSYWTYLNSSCLSVKTNLFIECGGFPRSIQSRAHTDLLWGLRISSFHWRWKLRKLPAYRLFPQQTSGRSSWLQELRMEAEDSQLFYRNCLSAEYYREAFPYLGRHFILRLIGKRCAQTKAISKFAILMHSGMVAARNVWKKCARIRLARWAHN